MTRDHIIGIDGNMPWHYPEDLKRFKRRTMNCAVIMGRVTWDAIGNKTLPGRRNIVLSRSPVAGVEHYANIKPAIAACQDEDAWIIGGAQVYRSAMEVVNLLDVTWVPDVIERADATRFPTVDWGEWAVAEESTLPGEVELVNEVYRRVE